MLIKLVNKTLKMNDGTFAPELEVVLRIPMEPMQDNSAQDPNFYENLGKELESVLAAK